MKFELSLENLTEVSLHITRFLSTGKDVQVVTDPAHNTTGYVPFPNGKCAASYRYIEKSDDVEVILHIGNVDNPNADFVAIEDEVIFDGNAMTIVSNSGFIRSMYLKKD